MVNTTTSNSARILYHDSFDGRGFTNENSLANALLTRPDQLNPVITHLAGAEDKRFPLTFLTEGQAGGTRTIEINDVQYEFPVIRRIRKSDAVQSTSYISTSKPGLNFTRIIVFFKTNWLKYQHTVMSPNGYQCRLQTKGKAVGSAFRYEMEFITNDPAAYVPPIELAAGTRWSMVGGASVSESFSMGNESNVMMPGKMKNQISFLRKSFHWGGNISNKTVECQFNVNGKQTNLWMPFERWQHMMQWKEATEEHIWYSQYNRLADGRILNIDPDSDLPIPYGAGVLDQIPNVDTYATLTTPKLKNTIGDVFYGMTDAVKMDVVLYTGLGGADEFDQAMKTEMRNFTQIVGDKFITGAGRNLRLGGFFTQYEHIDGHVVTIKLLNLLDYGGRAENAPKHPISGKPICSYDMYFLDQSTYDGERNVQMVTQKGRAMITGIHKGMAPLPADVTGNNTEMIATEQDKSALHYFSAKGVCIRRNTTSFKLLCSLS